MFGLMVWGVFNIKLGQETILDKSKQTLEKHDITVDKKGWHKIKALFPSLNTSGYHVFSEKRNS
jgi:hypothetical protein